MLVTLLFQDKLYTVRLPEKVRGQYFISDEDAETFSESFLGIEAYENEWIIRAGKHLQLFEAKTGEKVKEVTLQEGNIYPVRVIAEQVKEGYLLTEPFTEDRCRFQKYIVDSDCKLSIGSEETNEIEIRNNYVTAKHASLEWQNGNWILQDYNSTNGTYVNCKKVEGGKALSAGDQVFILGCKIIVGNDFLSINNPDDSVRIHTRKLVPYEKPEYLAREPETAETDFYCRIPHFYKEDSTFVMKVEAPPAKEKEDQTPIILTLAPSLMMGVASFASGIVSTTTAIQNNGNITQSLPTMLMSVSMLCGMVLFPFLMKKRDKKMKHQNELLRREKYGKYLAIIRGEIDKNIYLQSESLKEKFPFVLERVGKEMFWDGQLWDVTSEHPDFLKIRLGIGQKPLNAEIDFPENRFSIEDDEMRIQLERLQQEERVLENVPICLDFMEYRICGVVGEKSRAYGMLHNVLLQLASYYGYDEVKIMFIGDEKDLKEFSYIPYLPHIWDDEQKNRYLATNAEDTRELSVLLSKIFAEQLEEKEQHKYQYVVICTNKVLEERCGALADIMKQVGDTGFHIITFYERLQDLPGECDCIVQYFEQECRLVDKAGKLNNGISFVADQIMREKANAVGLRIAGNVLDLNRGRYELPDMLTFLQMFGVDKFEHLNVLSRWKENNPVMTLKTPVGVDTAGGTFYLDLHEKAHGPHGLVAGMTGSGKSEFIITLILSLAVNYHPDEVAFILIDYKGGGLAGAFDNEEYRLPHLAGTITNLDGASIVRSLVSIQSELRRRQTVFNVARAKVNEGTMDIYKYQKLYRDGIVSEAMPHLFIISDEFAELKSQQPEFMEQLISTARIGRSLGVHLILATQKPSGVVNEQIWANSKFKVCLKVQDRADSNDMLKRPDAAEITETGRFYLQVGYNELFEMGQSAWCGAPYTGENEGLHQNESIEMLNHLGKVVEKVKPNQGNAKGKKYAKQIVEVLRYISQIAKEEKASASPLWLPPLPEIIDCNMLIHKYQYRKDSGFVLNPVVGELDDPYNQRQDILTVPFTEKGNVLIYGNAGSGKNTFLTTMLYSLYRAHDGSELHTYICDFGAEALKCFEKAPQTGEVILNGEEDKLNGLFLYLGQEMEERKKLLSEAAGDFVAYNNTAEEKKANILVIINNYANFVESYENYEEKLNSLTRECTKYGIYFVITANSTSAIRYKLSQNFTQTFVMQLNDKSDYYNVLGNTGGVFPIAVKGRGIFRKGNVFEFQIAYPSANPETVVPDMYSFCRNLRDTYDGEFAKKIPTSKEKFDVSKLEEPKYSVNAFPVGLRLDKLNEEKYNFLQNSILQVVAKDAAHIAPYLQGIAEIASEKCHLQTVVFDMENAFYADEHKEYRLVSENFEKALDEIYDITVSRHKTCKEAEEMGEERKEFTPLMVVITSHEKLKEGLSEDGKSKLANMLLHLKETYHIAAVVADTEQDAGRSYVSGWRKEQCRGNGIYIGNNLAGQYILPVDNQYKNAGYKNGVDGSAGYIVRQGIPVQLKLVLTHFCKEEE